jgi:hypothetical protein
LARRSERLNAFSSSGRFTSPLSVTKTVRVKVSVFFPTVTGWFLRRFTVVLFS